MPTMVEATLQQLAARAVRAAPYPNVNFPPSRYYRFLKELTRYNSPSLSVELGVCGGGGCLHMCLGYSKGIVAGIDVSNDYPENIAHILENFPNFHFIIGDSVEQAKAVYDRWGKVDILFVDTTHTFEQTMKEYKAWSPYMQFGGIICFDDLFRPGMPEFWNQLHGEKYRLDFLHPGQYPEGGGFGVYIYKD